MERLDLLLEQLQVLAGDPDVRGAAGVIVGVLALLWRRRDASAVKVKAPPGQDVEVKISGRP